MKTYEKLLKMTPVKELVTLGLPSVFRLLVDELNSVIDAVFLGQFFGSDAVATGILNVCDVEYTPDSRSDFVVSLFTDSRSVGDLIRAPSFIYGLSASFIFTTNVFLPVMIIVGMERSSTFVFTMQQLIIFVALLFLLSRYGFNLAILAQPAAEVIGGLMTLLMLPSLKKHIHLEFNEAHKINLKELDKRRYGNGDTL